MKNLYRSIGILLIAFLAIEVSGQDIDPKEHGIYDEDLLPASFHVKKRDELRDRMPDNTVAVLFTSPVQLRSNDIYYDFVPDRDFYYLTGLMEPHAAVIIFKDPIEIEGDEVDEILYLRGRDPGHEIWDGKRLGVEGAKSYLNFDMVKEGLEFADLNLDWNQFDKVLYRTPKETPYDDTRDKGDLASMIKFFQSMTESLDEDKVDSYQLFETLARMREIKTDEELRLIRKACEITCGAHNELMRVAFPGMGEYQIQSLVEFYFGLKGAERKGFPSICGSGENTCILHYSSNRRESKNGDMVLVDIGAEYHGYTADVTRTFPINGKFTKEQKAIYDLVLTAQQAGMDKCKEGNKFWDPHTAAMQVIAKGLLKLGIIEKSSDVSKYFMHGTSHYMGLDVHDRGLYGPLKAGEIITVEPGIYISEGSDCDEKWWNIGVRIEDDILILGDGYENLSGCMPRTTEEIEAEMAKAAEVVNPEAFK